MTQNGKRKNQIEPTLRQKRAVDNILSGKFKTKGEALTAAGYSTESATVPGRLLQGDGIKVYLEEINKRLIRKDGKTLKQKVMDTYLDGLDATRLVGKDAVEHPDFATRKQFADRFSEFFGWEVQKPGERAIQHNQYNFFSVDQEKQDAFNRKLKDFLRTVGGESRTKSRTGNV